MSIIINDIDPFQWGLSKLSAAAATVTTNPFTDLINFAYPPLKAQIEHQHEIKKGTRSIARIMNETVIDSVETELKRMQHCAGLSDRVYLYTALNAPYEGNGSFLGSVLVVPLEDFYNREFKQELQEERLLTDKELEAGKDTFTDNEVLFQFARVSGQTHYSILKIIARVIIVALVIGLTFTPLGFLSGIVVLVGAAALYVPINRIVEERADIKAVRILSKRFQLAGYSESDALRYASNAAINCIKKIQLQNLDRRKSSTLARFLVTKKGNMRFDPASPSFSKRSRFVKEWEDKRMKKISKDISDYLQLLARREFSTKRRTA